MDHKNISIFVSYLSNWFVFFFVLFFFLSTCRTSSLANKFEKEKKKSQVASFISDGCTGFHKLRGAGVQSDEDL